MNKLIIGLIVIFLAQSEAFTQLCPSSYLWYREAKFVYQPSHILFDSTDSSFFVSALALSSNNATVISKTDKRGVVKWMYNYNFVIGDPLETQLIRKMLLTADGHLIGCGYHLLSKKGFVFRLDTATKMMTQVMVNESVCFSDIQFLPNGNLYIVGTVNPTAGIVVKQTYQGFLNPVNLSLLSSRIIEHPENNDHVSKVMVSDDKIYGVCDASIQQTGHVSSGSFYKFDIGGKILESFSYLSQSPDVTNTTNQDIIKDGNTIIAIGNSENLKSSTRSDMVHFYKFSGDSLVALQSYSLPQNIKLTWRHLQIVEDGYLIYGSYGLGQAKLWVTKTNKNGDVIWSKTYADKNEKRFQYFSNLYSDNQNFFTFSHGFDKQRINDATYLAFEVFGKNGEAPECLTVEEVFLQKESLTPIKENYYNHTYPNDNTTFEDLGDSRGGMGFYIDSTCRCKPCTLEGAIPDTLYFDYLLKINITPLMSGVNGNLTYSWKLLFPSGSLNCDTCKVITFSPDCPQKCECNDSKLVVNVSESPDCEWQDTIVLKYKLVAPCCNLSLVNLPDTLRFGSQDSIEMSGIVSGDLTDIRYTWQSDVGAFLCDTCKITHYKPNCVNPCDCKNAVVYFKAETFPTCTVADTIHLKYSVFLSDSIAIPNAFTPNGDNVNDIFTVLTKDKGCNKRITKFEIYNRWGQVVFSPFNIPNEDFSIGWDGRSDLNSEELPMDVYVYIIEITFDNQETKTYKGEVLLVR